MRINRSPKGWPSWGIIIVRDVEKSNLTDAVGLVEEAPEDESAPLSKSLEVEPEFFGPRTEPLLE
jgi:hypothetical protein